MRLFSAVLIGLVSVGLAAGQDALSPLPMRVGPPQVYGSLTARGLTKFEVHGLDAPELIGGVVVAGKDSKPSLKPFGFVEVTAGEVAAEIKVKAETEHRQPLEVKPFGDGWRIDGKGKVWVDVVALYKQTVTIDGQQIEFIRSFEQQEFQFVIESTSGPDPPGPGPNPDPDPEPGDSPFAEAGLRVLIVYERDDLGQIPEQQVAILFSTEMREWLNEHCAKNDGQAEYRILDKDTEQAGTGDNKWIDAMQRERGDLPWLIAGNGTRGYEGPLPASVAKTVELLEGLQ